MKNGDKCSSLLGESNRGFGPKFEDSDAYKTVTLQVEENNKKGRKKEEKRQQRMENIRVLDTPPPEVVEDTDRFF